MRDRLDKLQVEIKKSEKRNTGDELIKHIYIFKKLIWICIWFVILLPRLGMNLAKHKEGILRERDRLNAEVEELNKRLQIQRIYTDEIEQKRTDSEKKNKELYKLLDVGNLNNKFEEHFSNSILLYVRRKHPAKRIKNYEWSTSSNKILSI